MVANHHNENAIFPDLHEEKIELNTERVGLITLFVGLLIEI